MLITLILLQLTNHDMKQKDYQTSLISIKEYVADFSMNYFFIPYTPKPV